MKIVCISDTHNQHQGIEVPPGDVLIHAGDLTGRGRTYEVEDAVTWLLDQPHRHKILVAGNHDWLFQRQPELARALVAELHYLEDSGCELEGLHFWGSPWQPWFCDWAFNLKTRQELHDRWKLIPSHTDVLITHGPPFGIMDKVEHSKSVGCEALLETVERIEPRLHVFGHIHEGHGQQQRGRTLFVNASICDEAYRPVLKPIVVELSGRGES
ncbi:MAG: metallophosphatase domain-containing protein [Myxococcota bacterium]